MVKERGGTAVEMDWVLWNLGERIIEGGEGKKGGVKHHHRVKTIFY